MNFNLNYFIPLFPYPDITDVDKYFPGLLKATVEWYKIYKVPDGKPENKFAFNGEAKPAEFARKIIDETHHHWKALINKEIENTQVNWYDYLHCVTNFVLSYLFVYFLIGINCNQFVPIKWRIYD